MVTAMMSLSNMRGASHDVWAVNTDFDYHEEQKIEQPTPPDGAVPRPVEDLTDRAGIARTG